MSEAKVQSLNQYWGREKQSFWSFQLLKFEEYNESFENINEIRLDNILLSYYVMCILFDKENN